MFPIAYTEIWKQWDNTAIGMSKCMENDMCGKEEWYSINFHLKVDSG